jgi:hypothetical protein
VAAQHQNKVPSNAMILSYHAERCKSGALRNNKDPLTTCAEYGSSWRSEKVWENNKASAATCNSGTQFGEIE